MSTRCAYAKILILVDNDHTANAKDFEIIKKVHGFWVIQLKN